MKVRIDLQKSEKERERDVEYCTELLFLFLKGMMGALAPFSCLVKHVVLFALPT
jgi:hypothetical protein